MLVFWSPNKFDLFAAIAFLVVVLHFSLTWAAFNDDRDALLDVPKLGKIQGKFIKTAWTKRQVLQFLDIQYAQSPSGKNRFKPPRPVRIWRDIMDATVGKRSCPSVVLLPKLGKINDTVDIEDCLTMTITTPDTSGSYPVLFYIHGEYLYEGSNAEVPPHYLLEKDIVLVAPQYRLGPFGFLSTRTADIPGNAGALDIFAALTFVKRFIKYFGGDEERITVAGQVGGAAIAHALTLSPKVPRNLFKQVIYHSGSALMPIFTDSAHVKHASEIAIKVSACNTTTIRQLNSCLMEMPAKVLLEAFLQHAVEKSKLGIGHTGGVQFTIDDQYGFLPSHPYELMLKSNYSYPAMGGCPKNVGSHLLNDIVNEDFKKKIPDDDYSAYDYVDHIIRQAIGKDKNMFLTSYMLHDWFDNALLENGKFSDLISRLVDLGGALMHKLPVLHALSAHSKYAPQRTFLYSFDYRGEFNRFREIDEDYNVQSPFKAGVTLTDEALYLFPYPEHVKRLSVPDVTMAKMMVELWTNFVIDGHPGALRFGYWPPMTTLYGPYAKIDDTLTVGGDYFDELTATRSDEKNGISLVREVYFLRKRNTDKRRNRYKSIFKVSKPVNKRFLKFVIQ